MISGEARHEDVQIRLERAQVSEGARVDFADHAGVEVVGIDVLGADGQDAVGDGDVHVGCLLDDAVGGKLEIDRTQSALATHFEATMGLPVTENTASPARACRIIENGLAGLTFGVIIPRRSALIAFLRSPVSGVRYLDRDACVTVCCLLIGVVTFAVLIVRGPGTVERFEVDLLRRRDFVAFSDPRNEVSEPDVATLRPSVR